MVHIKKKILYKKGLRGVNMPTSQLSDFHTTRADLSLLSFIVLSPLSFSGKGMYDSVGCEWESESTTLKSLPQFFSPAVVLPLFELHRVLWMK